MLLNNHAKYHAMGIKDIKIKRGKPIMAINMQRSVSEYENWSTSVPIYKDDTREEIKTRLNVIASLLQDRQDDYATAWVEVEEKNKKEKEEANERKLKPVK